MGRIHKQGRRSSGGAQSSSRSAEVPYASDVLLSRVVEAIPNPVFVKDESHRIIFFNDAFCVMLGRTREELTGKSDFDLVPAEEARVYWEMDDAVFRSGRPTENQEALTDAEGACHWLLTRKSIVNLPDGKRLLVGVISDITEAKRREDELRLAKEGAEAANQAKSDFLAIVSHELRTPLNAVIGFSEILENQLFGPLGSPQYEEYVGDIRRSGMLLLGIINDILDVATIDMGGLVLKRQEIEPGVAVAECAKMLHGDAQRAGIELGVDVPDRLPRIAADPVRLRQILLNLLSNAIKFTPAGGSVRISARQEAGSITLTVVDTGIGMRAEDIPRALEPFQQVDAGLSRKHEGAGLGLPLAKRLAVLHGGTLEIECRLGEGTKVTVRLPAGRAPA